MKNLGQVLRGLLIALASVGLLFGGLSLSLAESNSHLPTTVGPSPTSTFTPIPSATAFSPTPTPTTSPTQGDTPTLQLPTPTLTPTLPVPPTNCPPPSGWVPYTVKAGDTLVLLSARYHVSVASLQQANCLTTFELNSGTILYVPPIPTQTRIPCGPPSGWIIRLVQPGDTLYKLSVAYGITVAKLQAANCMGTSTLLELGQALYVPPWPPILPTSTFPGGNTPTFVPTNTFIGDTPTLTPVPFFWTPTPTTPGP